MTKKLIFQGAEAKVYLISQSSKNQKHINQGLDLIDQREQKLSSIKEGRKFQGNFPEWEKPKSPKTILKTRIPKSYRHQTLDENLRKSRTKKEAKILQKAHSLKINVPNLISSDKFDIEMEYLDGEKLSDSLNSYPEKKQFEIMKKIGTQTALLHENDLIHGDLTTSNIIFKDDKVFIIDFGLGYISTKSEDKAVDLHLIKQALEAKHWKNHEKLFKNFLKGYKLKGFDKILERLTRVEKRGRYKH